MEFNWQERLATVPHEPGVYLMRDPQGTILYVGKATDLKQRLRSYFQPGADSRFFVPLLEELLGDGGGIDTILTASPKEALLLENQLIKRHQPRFNVRLKDDKDFLWLHLDPRRRFPRLVAVRRHKRHRQNAAAGDGPVAARETAAEAHGWFFGPYPSGRAIRETRRLINRHFQLRSCSDTVFRTRRRPCLQHQIGRCPGPCALPVAEEDYRRNMEDVRLFLSGRGDALRKLCRRLDAEMRAAAAALEFERAARLRDRLRAVRDSLEQQNVELAKSEDLDVFGFHREEHQAAIQVTRIRGGLTTGSRTYPIEGLPWSAQVILADFVGRYYDDATTPPPLVLLPLAIDDAHERALILSERREGRRVELRAPLRGRYRKLVDHANRNARQGFEERHRSAHARREVLARVQQRLGLAAPPRQIECYDISELHGSEPVGSRAVFVDGAPKSSLYRHYRLRARAAGNDFAMLHEVLTRRLRPREGRSDPWPDLIVVDGGLGQLNAARRALEELGIALANLAAAGPAGRPAQPSDAGSVALVALAKSRVLPAGDQPAARHSPERLFLPGRKNPVILPPYADELQLLTRLRDEAHRFAITFHRTLRTRAALTSRLEEVPGLGPARRRALLKHFGSLKRIREAKIEELRAVPGIPRKVAEALRAWVEDSR